MRKKRTPKPFEVLLDRRLRDAIESVPELQALTGVAYYRAVAVSLEILATEFRRKAKRQGGDEESEPWLNRLM